jgi:hypothetical protein
MCAPCGKILSQMSYNEKYRKNESEEKERRLPKKNGELALTPRLRSSFNVTGCKD